jgi:hypothetical protein
MQPSNFLKFPVKLIHVISVSVCGIVLSVSVCVRVNVLKVSFEISMAKFVNDRQKLEHEEEHGQRERHGHGDSLCQCPFLCPCLSVSVSVSMFMFTFMWEFCNAYFNRRLWQQLTFNPYIFIDSKNQQITSKVTFIASAQLLVLITQCDCNGYFQCLVWPFNRPNQQKLL